MKRKHDADALTRPKRTRSMGIRGKLIVGILVPLVAVLTLIGVFLNNQVISIIGTLKTDDLQKQVMLATTQTEAYFETAFSTAELVQGLDVVRGILSQADAAGAGYSFRQSELYAEAEAVLKEAAASLGENVQAVWLAGVKNSQIFQSNDFLSDSSFVVTQRAWYKLLEKKPGQAVLTGAYEDVSNGKLIVTAAVPVYRGTTQELMGAVGVDILLDNLCQQMSQISIGETGFVVLYDSDKDIIYHPDSSLIMTNLADSQSSENLQSSVAGNQPMTVQPCQLGGEAYYGGTSYLEEIGWVVLGCMPEAEYLHEQNTAMYILLGGFSICALLLAGVCVWQATSVVRPIQKLSQVANHLAAGALDVQLPAVSGDEIGQLSTSIANIVERLKTYILYIDEIAQVLDGLGHGELVFQLHQDYVGEFQRLKTAMLDIQQSLSSTIRQIINSAELVTNNAEQGAHAAQSLAQGATQQASTVQELAATVQELSSQAHSDSSQAVAASQELNAIEAALEQSNRKMGQMLGAMENISVQSSEIEKIIKTIEDIAFQTNILALNAAVEAARAGAAGKGFAVVADEVRNLASKSSDAAKNTTALIESSIEAVSRGEQIAHETASSLETVAAKSRNVVDAINAISSNYQQQAATLGQVAEGINQISAVVETNSATAEESAASSQELSGQAHVLRGLTERFHLDSTGDYTRV